MSDKGQILSCIEQLELLCENIWRNKSVDWKQIGEMIQQLNPILEAVLLNSEKNLDINIDAEEVMHQMTDLMLALKCRDEMAMADLLYFEIKEMLLTIAEGEA